MTESDLERAVRRLIAQHGLYGYHVPDSRRSRAGWPDWVILGRKILYRELKSPYGSLRPEQLDVSYRLRAAGADWAVWRPLDLTSGRIAAELAALALPR